MPAEGRLPHPGDEQTKTCCTIGDDGGDVEVGGCRYTLPVLDAVVVHGSLSRLTLMTAVAVVAHVDLVELLPCSRSRRMPSCCGVVDLVDLVDMLPCRRPRRYRCLLPSYSIQLGRRQ